VRGEAGAGREHALSRPSADRRLSSSAHASSRAASARAASATAASDVTFAAYVRPARVSAPAKNRQKTQEAATRCPQGHAARAHLCGILRGNELRLRQGQRVAKFRCVASVALRILRLPLRPEPLLLHEHPAQRQPRLTQEPLISITKMGHGVHLSC
jgi:hypothetical protein